MKLSDIITRIMKTNHKILFFIFFGVLYLTYFQSKLVRDNSTLIYSVQTFCLLGIIIISVFNKVDQFKIFLMQIMLALIFSFIGLIYFHEFAAVIFLILFVHQSEFKKHAQIYYGLIVIQLVICLIIHHFQSAQFTNIENANVALLLIVYLLILISVLSIYRFIVVREHIQISQNNILKIIGGNLVKHIHDFKGLVLHPMLSVDDFSSYNNSEEENLNKEHNLQQRKYNETLNLTQIKLVEIRNLLNEISNLVKQAVHSQVSTTSNSLLLKIFKSIFPNYFSATQLISSLVFLLEAISEPARLHPSLQTKYMIAKLSMAITALFIYILVLMKNNNSQLKLFAYANMLLVMFFSSIYLPEYHIGFLQVSIAMMYLFIKEENFYILMTTISAFLMMFAMLMKNIFAIPTVPVQKIDISLEIIIFSIILYFSYQHLHKLVIRNEAVSNKFILLGKKAVLISNDIKCVIDKLISDLEQRISHLNSNNFSQINELKTQLQSLGRFAEGLYSFNQEDSNSEQRLKIIADQVFNVIKGHHPLFFNYEEDRLIFTKFPNSIRSILYNLMMNSLESAVEHQVKNLKIKINIEGQQLTYFDNAGGVSVANLLRLQQGVPFTTKSDGSGLGTQIIRHELLNIGSEPYYLAIDSGLFVRFDIQ